MSYRKEYVETLVLSKQQLYDFRRAQFKIREDGYINPDQGKLSNGLQLFTGVLSFAFKLPTPLTLSAAVIASVLNFPSELATIKILCQYGENYLQALLYQFDEHPSWEYIEVELPFLEFINEKYRICQGHGILKATRIGGHWYTV